MTHLLLVRALVEGEPDAVASAAFTVLPALSLDAPRLVGGGLISSR